MAATQTPPENRQPAASAVATGSASFVDVSNDYQREQGEERWLRRIDPKCWISALHRRTGFGWMEWETAIVFVIEPGSRPKRWGSDDRDCLIIGGDRRERALSAERCVSYEIREALKAACERHDKEHSTTLSWRI
jgi:hypothetical protein